MRTESLIPAPPHLGSYEPDDVTFLLTELRAEGLELPAETRRQLLRDGGHYAETLPIEYRPTERYERLFEKLLEQYADRIALQTRVLARRLLSEHGDEPRPVRIRTASRIAVARTQHPAVRE